MGGTNSTFQNDPDHSFWHSDNGKSVKKEINAVVNNSKGVYIWGKSIFLAEIIKLILVYLAAILMYLVGE